MKADLLKRFPIMLGLFILSSLLLAACSGGEGEAGENADGNTTITMMHYYNKELGEPAPMAQLEKIEEFEEQNSDVIIEQEVQSHDNYETKVKTLAAGNELPDVFLIKGSMTQQFADNGQALLLNDFLAEKEGWEEQFIDGAFTPFQVEDEIYAMPISGGSSHLIYYNKALFEEAGISEFPSTWDEFLGAIDRLNESGVTPIALGNKGKWVLNSSYLSTLANRYTGSEWFDNILAKNGEASFTDQEFVDALSAIDQLANNNAFNSNMNSIDNSEQQAMYMNEQAAMFIEGGWAAGSIANNAPEAVLNNTEVAIFPEIEGAQGEQNTVSGGGGWAYAINPNVSEEKLEKIKEFIYHLTNQEAGRLILEKGQMPAVVVPDSDEMELPVLTRKLLTLFEESKFVPIYDTVLDPALIEVMNSNMQNMTIDQVTPQEAAENIQAEYSK
ncbi:extracellular solute-binding protein [Bacillaceae bacterium SIJ1]|uniref:ABC transporter substrate-binding protein n=1 Tax=Litoribacterium kuwaitense TaxID=1398745 RepID=UPI0013EDAA35|nr:extracellular solute-binding protein [Litoribacterium kuwaitense]NGP45427.1 extracellular solute-binding protein [Litoribacterium kuwaitense]